VIAGPAEKLLEDAPCGYLTTSPDGTIAWMNRTFERWTGLRREDVVGVRRFADLLTPGGQIYHETHYAPLLQMQGAVRAIAFEIVRADGTKLSALVNAVLADGAVRVVVMDATDRRRYEEELLQARRREQDVALELQRSLLAGALQAGEGVEIGVAYRPAEKGLEVGGDWYDAFWLEPNERIGLVVGDVVGRGLTAATTMGQMRSALRALASTGFEPGALLEALSEFSHRHGVGQMATVAYAEVDVRTREVRYACAGHPPPALMAPGEAPRLAWEGRSTPLDAHIDWDERPEGVLDLAPGSTLVLYTDGLIERSDRPLNTGFDALLEALAEHDDAAPAVLATALTEGLVPAHGRADDVCVLALRVGGAG
jgi:PAS domain S-box-containing protein